MLAPVGRDRTACNVCRVVGKHWWYIPGLRHCRSFDECVSGEYGLSHVAGSEALENGRKLSRRRLRWCTTSARRPRTTGATVGASSTKCTQEVATLTQQSPTVFHSTAHLDHRPKTLDRRQRRIQCAAAVVADDHAARAGLNRQNCILGAQNPLRATHEKDDRHALSVGAGTLAQHKVRLPS